MEEKNKRYHLIFWTIKLGIIFYFYQLPFIDNNYFWSTSLISLLAHLSYFYGNYSFLYPKFFAKKKYFIYLIGVLLFTLLHFVILIWSWNHFTNFHSINWIAKLNGVIGASTVFLSISFTWKLLETWVANITEKMALEKELKKTEYEFLKSQINPHFLFNVLGCINGLAIVKSDKTIDAISNLKGLIGSAFLMKTGEKVALRSELEFLRSFINLHEIRYTVLIELSFPDDRIDQYKIEPMLLLPFIENAFKHGDLTDTGCIKISFEITDDILNFSVENKLIENADNTSGIGHENVRKRLNYVYADRHNLNIRKLESTYNVNLKISLKDE